MNISSNEFWSFLKQTRFLFTKHSNRACGVHGLTPGEDHRGHFGWRHCFRGCEKPWSLLEHNTAKTKKQYNRVFLLSFSIFLFETTAKLLCFAQRSLFKFSKHIEFFERGPTKKRALDFGFWSAIWKLAHDWDSHLFWGIHQAKKYGKQPAEQPLLSQPWHLMRRKQNGQNGNHV